MPFWSPDTCTGDTKTACHLGFSGSNKPENFIGFQRRCDRHALLTGTELVVTVLDENTRKNLFLNLAKLVVASLEEDKYTWQYDLAGVLQITPSIQLSVKQRKDIQANCDSYFGTGKVKIN